MAQDLTEELVVHLAEIGRDRAVTVLSESEIELMINHAKDVADLSTDDCRRVEECLRRITTAAEADLVLYGRIDRLDDSYVAVLSLLDVGQGSVLRSESCAAESKEALRPVLLQTGERILALQSRPSSVSEAPEIEGNESSHAAGRLRPQGVFFKPKEGRKIAVLPLGGLTDQPDIAMTLTQTLGFETRR